MPEAYPRPVPGAAFTVTYDGPALANGQMPVRDLAPALFSLSEIFAAAADLELPSDREAPALTIQATREGSFNVELALHAHSSWASVRDLFSGNDATALANIIQIVSGASVGGMGLFKLVQWARGRNVVAMVPQPPDDSGRAQVRIELDDGDHVVVDGSVLALYRNLEVRREVYRTVRPLNEGGVDVLRFAVPHSPPVEIRSEEVTHFEPPPLEVTPLGESVVTKHLSIAMVAFNDGNKWRFTDGTSTFYALILDGVFMSKVNAGEAFRKGDTLKCTLRMKEYQEEDGTLHTEYFIDEVQAHIPRPQQISM